MGRRAVVDSRQGVNRPEARATPYAVRVSARPSDSIALALRVGAPIRCADQVLTEAGIVIPDEQEDEVEKFREFLDNISPEDFQTGSQ